VIASFEFSRNFTYEIEHHWEQLRRFPEKLLLY